MVIDMEFSFRRKNGENGVGLVSTCLIDVDGVPCIQVIVRDITERQRFEEERRRTERLSSLGLLATGVAHDFNNVLTAVMCAGEMIQMDSPDPKAGKWADKIMEAGSHAQAVVKALLTFARQSSTQVKPFDAHEAVRTAVTIFKMTAATIEVDLSGLKAVNSGIVGLSASLQNAVLNLCLNARDAMPQGGKITISSFNEYLDKAAVERFLPFNVATGACWCLSIADQGIGMNPETLKKCFEPFFTTKGEQATGLGLASVHSAELEHRGAVTVESEVGRGTKFTLWFPQPANGLTQQWVLSPAVSARPGAVLLAESDASARAVMSGVLKEMESRCH